MSADTRVEVTDISLTLPRGQIDGATLRAAMLRPALNLFRNDPNEASPDDIVILENVNFSARPGDRVGLLGWNGAGKTSLLKIVAGIYPATAGDVDVQGRIGTLLSLEAGFDAEATGRENTFLQGLTMGYALRDLKEAVADIEEFADIGEYFDMPVRTYSSGMRVRLSFSIATAFDPDILIMDEWLSVGDERFSEKAEARLSSLVERTGILLLASHNSYLLQRVCNRAVVMHRGHIAFDGGVDDALAFYRQL